MAVADAMFIFEVVVGNVKSLVESRNLVIRSDFADIFSLELKDPKQMHIVIPDPPPLPPEPPGKGKKKKPPPKKGKKGKGEPPPPPEPAIQSGQSVLFTSSAEFLIQSMRKFPMEVSLWSKEDNLSFIGSSLIPWDSAFLKYLERLCNCEEPQPVTLIDEYNIFEEDTAKLMAKINLQIKLSHLGDKVTTSFRTLSEDPAVKKCLYTGINSKVTSYICTMKTTDEVFEDNCNKIENTYIKEKPKGQVFADYKNAPGADLSLFSEGDYCCMNNADKPPDSIYQSPQTMPDINFIVDYIRKVVVSCNDNMRMLTPHPAIRPKVRATDIDRLCYCKETQWPTGELAQRFKKEVQGGPCPICVGAGKKPEGRAATFDLANIRGPCGKPDCKIARDIRAYIENLVDEDNTEIDINEIIGPCGSNLCTLAEKIQEFLRHEGVFNEPRTLKGLSTQCACIQQMQEALTKRKSCTSICSKDCEDASDSEDSACGGKGCPFPGSSKQQVYNVYYFTVEYDNADSDPGSIPAKFKNCAKECPSLKASEVTSCSKSVCTGSEKNEDKKCPEQPCPSQGAYPPSPADSNIEIDFEDINNPCCVKTCDVSETVKDFIVDGVAKKKKKDVDDDPCFCDCVCTFKFTKNTTYCSVCGGYECMGDDMNQQPAHLKPHPCPVYHKLYDKNYIKTKSPWPEDDKPHQENMSAKSSKTDRSRVTSTVDRRTLTSTTRSVKKEEKKATKEPSTEQDKKQKTAQEKKKVGKFTANVQEGDSAALVEKKPETKYPYPQVPKNMGWNWTAEDIPGMKPRPKWKPGAVNKILMRRYRALREGSDTIAAKKKRALMQKKKKQEMKPTLVVTKKDGEYTVNMEVFKKYSKERLIFQNPYDEKPPLVYTIGKTEEEKRKIQKQRERRERRETRRKSRLLQSTFRDKCQEICVKAYNQAIGILPLPNPNDPNCPCHTKEAQNITPPIDSCSCSEEGSISSSDTDGDEWVVEFTPPAARWDAKAKHPPVYADNESQYTYLDYKVKVLDKQGNQVPRYFKGPDGKQVCSDLGGFWSPDHVWMEINKDGYIGPDNRWIPMNFIGPDGMFYSAEEGFFTDNTGKHLKLGIDGYIDKDGKWAWYPRHQRVAKSGKSKSSVSASTKDGRTRQPQATQTGGKNKANETKGRTSPIIKTENKASPAASTKTRAGKDKTKKAVSYGTKSTKKPVVMSISANFDTNRFERMPVVPSFRSRAADARKLARYREIMSSLQMYADIGDVRPPLKSNRASNTPRKKLSPFTIFGGPRNMSPNLEPVCSSGNRTYSTISQVQSGSCLQGQSPVTCF